MDIQRISYFLTVAECLNFTKAAARHHLAQTAMSRHICALENELGVMLFVRNNRAVRLTEAGEAFVGPAAKLLQDWNQALDAVRRAGSVRHGSVRLAFGPHEKPLVTETVRQFHDRYPEIDLQMSQHGYKELADGFASGRFDLVYSTVRIPRALDNARYKVLSEHVNMFILAKDHPLAKRGCVLPEDFRSLDVAVHCESGGPFTPEDVSADFEDRGIHPRSFVAVNSLDAKFALVEACNMASSLPTFLAESLRDRFFVFLPPAPTKTPAPYCVSWLETNPNPAAQLFFESIESAGK